MKYVTRKPGSPEVGAYGLRAGLAELAFFSRYLRPVAPLVCGIVAVSLASSALRLPMFYLPIVLTRHFDGRGDVYRWLAPAFGERSYLYAFIVIALTSAIVASALSLLRGFWSAKASEALLYQVRLDAFKCIEHLSMQAVYARGAGEFVQRLTRDLYYVRDLYGETLSQLVTFLLQAVVFVIMLLYLNLHLTVFVLVCFSLTIPIVGALNRRVERCAGQLQRLNEQIVSQLVECVGGYRDIRASGTFERLSSRFSRTLGDARVMGVNASFAAQCGGAATAIATTCALTLPYLLYAGSLNSVVDVGHLIAYVGVLSQVLPLFSLFTRSTSDIALATPSLRAVRAIFEQSQGNAGALGPVGHTNGHIELALTSIRFERVGLSIGTRRILHDVSFELPPGELSAIVGQSGAGKTTIFHLLLRLMRPTEGVILVNDRPLDEYGEALLRRMFGFIPQNPFIFNQSLRENLRLASPDERDGRVSIDEAVDLAQLRSVVERRSAEGGLDAGAGYMGMQLSAGERQRVALARLLVQDPHVIICDEYTANIDVKTAEIIDEMMRTHFAGRTRLLITHELYTIRGAKHIIVLDQGRVEASGRHDDLMARPGLYSNLWHAQQLA